jgi:L-fuconolactonase
VLPEKELISRPYRRIRPGTPLTVEPFTPDDLIRERDVAGVDRALLTPAYWGVDDLGLVTTAAQRRPDRFGVIRKLELDSADRSDEVRSWMEPPGVLGFRLLLHAEPNKTFLSEGAFEWLWRAAEEQQIPIMVQPHGSVPLLADVAERYPGLRLIVDHFALAPDAGIGEPREESIDPSIDQLICLADRPNVAVKASCLPNYVSGEYPFVRLHARIRRVVEHFGAERVFWGSDLSRLRCSYRELVTMFVEELPFLSPRELGLVMGAGIANWLRWPPSPYPIVYKL